MKNTIELSARCPFYMFDNGLSVTCNDGEEKLHKKFRTREDFCEYTQKHCFECFPEGCAFFRRLWNKY